MKKIVKQLFFLSLCVALLASCKKEENKVYFQGGTAPVLTSSVTTPDLPLSFAAKDNEALNLSWTNPNYNFNTGISSQDVNYLIEIDTAGSNFTNPQRQSIAVGKVLERSFTVEKINDYLLNQLVLVPGTPHEIEIRVTSTLTNNSLPLYSNIVKYTVTPYAIPPKVQPPGTPPDYLDGDLYIVGSATAGDWNNPVPEPSQKFTKIDVTHYEITVPLTGGKEYLFIPLNGDWSHKYACTKTADQSPEGGDFGRDLPGNFPGPVVSGNYKIEIDFQRGKYTVKKL